MKSATLTLAKTERISGRTLPEELFNGGKSRSMSAFPIRMIYMRTENGEDNTPGAKILVSVPKRRFKHAVIRNRVKRQIREAYRKNKSIILGKLHDCERQSIAIAFIWQDNSLHKSPEVEDKIIKLLTRLREKL